MNIEFLIYGLVCVGIAVGMVWAVRGRNPKGFLSLSDAIEKLYYPTLQEIKNMRNEKEIENEIQQKKLTAPRLTPELIDAAIVSDDYHVFPESCLTVCCLTLKNGFTVTGESACASPENFDADIGRKVAYGNARDKIWQLEGYLLKQQLYQQANY